MAYQAAAALAAALNDFLLFLPIALGVLIGVVSFGIAWGGRRAGMLFGVLALASSLWGFWGLLLTAPQLWWISVIPRRSSASLARQIGNGGSPKYRMAHSRARESQDSPS